MPHLTIYSDLKISKQRRRHVVATDDNTVERWYGTITEALQACLDLEENNITIEDDMGKYQVLITKIDDGE